MIVNDNDHVRIQSNFTLTIHDSLNSLLSMNLQKIDTFHLTDLKAIPRVKEVKEPQMLPIVRA